VCAACEPQHGLINVLTFLLLLLLLLLLLQATCPPLPSTLTG
jgi:hypothetical protein